MADKKETPAQALKRTSELLDKANQRIVELENVLRDHENALDQANRQIQTERQVADMNIRARDAIIGRELATREMNAIAARAEANAKARRGDRDQGLAL